MKHSNSILATVSNLGLSNLSVPNFSQAEYKSRISKFWQAMLPNSVAIFVANPEQTRSNDTHYPYRQSSDIVYLNGFHEPNSILVISKLSAKQEVFMFVEPKDKHSEQWTGIRVGVEAAGKKYSLNRSFAIDEFAAVINDYIAQCKAVYYRFGINPKFDTIFSKIWHAKPKTLIDPGEILDELRLFKSEAEIKMIRHAAKISAAAHKQAMLECKPGIYEYQLQSVLEMVFRAHGATGPAYGSIVAKGGNAWVLHYVENNDQIRNGDLVLIDAACEFGAGLNGGYAADITRTFPANGKFSKAQKEIYELVLEAQEVAIANCTVGTKLIDVQNAAEKVLQKGLIKLGLLKQNKKTSTNAKRSKSSAKALSLRDFLPHGTSHWLGLDVHDVGNYDQDANNLSPKYKKAKSASQTKSVRKGRLLLPGMVITVEPGLYFAASDTRVPLAYRGIGIRIEDDVHITAKGPEVLTSSVPKSVAEIEKLMSSS